MIKSLKSTLLGGMAALLLGVSMSASAVGVPLVSGDAVYTGTNGFGPRVDQTYTAVGTGAVSFSWSSNATYEGPGLFNAGYLLNNVETVLSNDHFTNAAGGDFGSDFFNVVLGDVFGFYVYGVTSDNDNVSGAANLFIDQLTQPRSNDVPEPGSLALLGLALVGLAAVRRHKAA